MSIRTNYKLNDGHTIPWLAIGTGTAHYGRDASNAVLMALGEGVTHLDGAQIYGNEQYLGSAITSSGIPRESIFLTTKLGPVPAGQTVVDTLRESLQKLQTTYVDLFLMHAPFHHQDFVASWREMEEAQRLGLARSIGVSNFRVQELEIVLKHGSIVPAVNQIEFHPYITSVHDPILAFCKEHNIVVASYGGLTPIFRVPDGPVTPVLEDIRQRLEKTRGAPVSSGQVLMRWLMQQEIVVITTSSKKERVKEYFDTLNLPDLTSEEIEAIRNAGKKHYHRQFLKRDMESLPDSYPQYNKSSL